VNLRLPRWFGRNIGTFLLAFIMAVIVWVSAVNSDDPSEEASFLIPIEIVGLGSDLELISEIPDELELTLLAPRSILDQIDVESGVLKAWVDVSGLEAGTHLLSFQYQIASQLRPIRVININPASTEQTLEGLVSRNLDIQANVMGEPTLGYQAEEVEWSHDRVTVSGRASQVDQIVAVKTTLSIVGAEETIERNLKLVAVDENDNIVADVILNPNEITVVQPITLRGGYRNMVIKVLTMGQVADGYRQTSISVSPPNIMVFSADPSIIDQLPGFVETDPLMLTDAVDDIETSVALNLPEGVSAIGDPNVLVQVGIAAMEGNVKILRQVEIIGVLPEFLANVAPETIEVILFGPLPELESMIETDVRVVVDVTDLEEGIYQLAPVVNILPERIQAEAISPETLEVEIIRLELPTPTLEPTPTEEPTPTPTPTEEPTPTPNHP